MFSLNEKVVYPGHGVAQISRIVEKSVGGATVQFFELSFINKGITVLVPTNNLSSVGLRKLSSAENIQKALKMLAEPGEKNVVDINNGGNWNKRQKEYQSKLRTGNLVDICKIYRDLKYIASRKGLSFGEKHLLSQTEALLVEEISLVNQVGEDQTIEQLRSLCGETCHDNEAHSKHQCKQ